MMHKGYRILRGLPFMKIWPVLIAYESRAVSLSRFHLLTLAVYPLAYLLLLGAGVSGLASGHAGDTSQFVGMRADIAPRVIAMRADAPLDAMIDRCEGGRLVGVLA